jgi:recombination protein RecA
MTAKKKDDAAVDEVQAQEPTMDTAKFLKGLAKSLTKEFGDDSVQLFDSNEGHVDNVKTFIKTGVPMIDYILGGKGFPVGRISEIYGEPSSGKTAIAMHLLKQTIDNNGVAIMLDSEAAFSFDMAQKIGLDRTKLLYMKPKTLEEIWQVVEQMINYVKLKSPNQLATIVVDSIASAPSVDEVEGDITKAEMGMRARINSKGLRKLTVYLSDSNICLIFVNQIRAAIGVVYGDQEMIPGGKSIDFHTTIKLRVHKGKIIRDESKAEKLPIGQFVKLRVTKNKLANPHMEADLELFYDRGIPINSGLMEKMQKDGVLVRKGAYLAFGDETFYAKDFDTFIMNHPELLEFSTWINYKRDKLLDE